MALSDIAKHASVIKNPLGFFGLYIVVLVILFRYSINATYENDTKIWIVACTGLLMIFVLIIASVITIIFPKNWYEVMQDKISKQDDLLESVSGDKLKDYVEDRISEALKDLKEEHK